MKFNKLAKELNLSVAELAEKANAILPNANGGTEVSEQQKEKIMALLADPEPSAGLAFLESADPILSILTERIEQEEALETPEQLVDEMIARYLQDPEDLPTDPDYKAAIVTYVSLVKKRQQRKQQRSSKVRSLLRKCASAQGTAEPLQLEHFYSNGPNTADNNSKLSGKPQTPKLAAANS